MFLLRALKDAIVSIFTGSEEPQSRPTRTPPSYGGSGGSFSSPRQTERQPYSSWESSSARTTRNIHVDHTPTAPPEPAYHDFYQESTYSLGTKFNQVETHIRSYLVDGSNGWDGLNPADYNYGGTGPFPYKKDLAVTWYTENINRSGLANYPVSVSMINLQMTTSSQTVEQAVRTLRSKLPPSGQDIYYHATHAQAAVNILRNGIDLTKCKGQRDFSSNKGFYASQNYEKSIRWALRRSEVFNRQIGAIIAFRVSDQLMREHDLSLEVQTKAGKARWRRTVKYFRHSQWSEDVEASLRGVKYIKGPVLANAIMSPNDVPHWLKFDQICLCDDEFAQQFGRLDNICFVVFFQSRDDNK